MTKSSQVSKAFGLRPAILLDRDGTLIVERHYLSDPGLVEIEDGVAEALSKLADAGWPLVVLSNQSGIGRGYFSQPAAEAVNARVAELLGAHGVAIEGWFMCPHVPEDHCDCRKPGTGLALRAANELGLDLSRSWMIGDKQSDVEMALAVGVRPILVTTGHGKEEARHLKNTSVAICASLEEAERLIALN